MEGIVSDDSTLDSLYHSDDSNNHCDGKPPIHPEFASVLSSSPCQRQEMSTPSRASSSENREKSTLSREKSTSSREKLTSRREKSTANTEKLIESTEKSITSREKSTLSTEKSTTSREKSIPNTEKSIQSRENTSCYRRSKCFVMSSSKSETEPRDRRKSVNNWESRRSQSKECISRNSLDTQDETESVTFNDSETEKQQDTTNILLSKNEMITNDANRRVSKSAQETSELKIRTLIDRDLTGVGESCPSAIKSYLRHLSSSETSVLGQIVRKIDRSVFS